MSEFSISSEDFKEGEEIPKNCGYKQRNRQPEIYIRNYPADTKCLALIMDDPDAMGAVGKVWVHWLYYTQQTESSGLFDFLISGMTDFCEIGYGGPARPD